MRTEQRETAADSEIQKDSGSIFLLRRDEIKRYIILYVHHISTPTLWQILTEIVLYKEIENNISHKRAIENQVRILSLMYTCICL